MLFGHAKSDKKSKILARQNNYFPKKIYIEIEEISTIFFMDKVTPNETWFKEYKKVIPTGLFPKRTNFWKINALSFCISTRPKT